MELLDRMQYASEAILAGDKLMEEGKIKDAIEEYKTAVEFLPTWKTLNKLGEAHYADKNYLDAFKRNFEAMTLNPDIGKVKNDLGLVEYQNGRFDRAIYYLEQALLDEALPDKDLTILYLGMCNYELNEWGKALHYYEIYSQYHPEDEDIKFIMNDIRRQIN